MPDLERREWIAYFELEPIPDPTRDAAQVCAVIANANRGKGTRPFKTEDFVPRVAKSKRRMSTSEMRAAFLAATKRD